MLQSKRIRFVALLTIASFAAAGCGARAAGVSPGASPTQQASSLPAATAPSPITSLTTPTPLVTAATSPVPGERVVFGVRGDSRQIFSQLPDGSDYRQVTTGPGNHICAALSPDARTIAYCGDASGNFEIWTVNPDGTNDAQLTKLGGNALFPAFSPDGTNVALRGT